MCLFECCIDCHKVLQHQPLFRPDPSFVGLSSCVFSNVVTFRAHSKSTLSVQVARDDPGVVFVAVSLDVSVHVSNVHVRVSRVGEVRTG